MTALADQALADFAAREGISLKGAAAPRPAERSMGATEKPPRPELRAVVSWTHARRTACRLRARLGRRARARLRKRRVTASSSCSATCTTALAVGGAAGQSRRLPRRHAARRASSVVLSYDLGNGLTHRTRRRARREVGGRRTQAAAARAAAGDPVDQPLPALSRQPARARQRSERRRTSR